MNKLATLAGVGAAIAAWQTVSPLLNQSVSDVQNLFGVCMPLISKTWAGITLLLSHLTALFIQIKK